MGDSFLVRKKSRKLEVKDFTAKNVMILRNFPEWSFVFVRDLEENSESG